MRLRTIADPAGPLAYALLSFTSKVLATSEAETVPPNGRRASCHSKRLKVLIDEGQRLATGLRKLLTENYGVRSEKLAEFGMQPFRGRKVATLRRKAGEAENAEPPAPPTAPLDLNS